MLGRRTPPSLCDLSLIAFADLIHDMSYHIENGLYTKEDELNILQIQDMLRSIPFQLVNEVLEEVLASLISIEQEFDHYAAGGLCRTGDAIVNTICDSNVTNLSFNKVHGMFHAKITSCLHKMSRMRSLTLESYGSNNLIASAVSNMKNLVVFHILGCTDDILTAVAQNCHQLQVLRVLFSWDVTDKSMKELHQCKSLRCIDLDLTSVSSLGFASVLKSVQSLREVDYFNFSDALRYLDDSNPMAIIDIKDFVLYTDLHKMAKLFPSLQSMSVDMFNGDCNENTTYLFPQLRNVEICHGHFFRSGISKMLSIVGFSLNSLDLFHVECLSERAIDNITESCPNLMDLALLNCSGQDQTYSMQHYWNVSCFHNLKTLTVEQCTLNVEYILSHSPNITFLYISKVEGIFDDSLFNILTKTKTRFSKLKELHISSDLGILDEALVQNLKKCIASVETIKLIRTPNEIMRDIKTYGKKNKFNM